MKVGNAVSRLRNEPIAALSRRFCDCLSAQGIDQNRPQAVQVISSRETMDGKRANDRTGLKGWLESQAHIGRVQWRTSRDLDSQSVHIFFISGDVAIER
jgi:hypothetical protein